MTTIHGNEVITRHRICGILWLALVLGIALCSTPLTAHAAAGGTLTVGTVSGNPGTPVTLAVALTAGSTGFTSLQFDLGFASTLTYVSTASGAASTAASKMVSGSAVAGGMRVVVMGLNQTAIGSGEIAIVQLTIASSAPAGAIPVSISNIVASDKDAQSVSVDGVGGTVTVNGSVPGTPGGLSPANGATNVAVTPSLIWSAASGATSYDVYLGTTNPPSLATSTSMTSYAPSALSNSTVYYWKVVAKNGSGSTSSSTVSFTTAAPVDTTGPVFSSISAGSITASGAVITWTTNEASDSQVEYGTTLSFGSTTSLNAALVTGHSQALTGLSAGTLYYYRVKSRDAANNLSVSSTYNFTTISAAPPAPSNLAPGNGAVDISLTPILSWSASAGASSYDIFLGTSSNPPLVVSTPSTSYAPPALTANTVYYWRVVATNSMGSATSGTYSFTTISGAPGAPTNLYPIDGATGISLTPTLTWSGSAGASSYDVYFGTDSNCPLVSSTIGTSYQPPALTGGKYYWRIVAKNSFGSTSSAAISFTAETVALTAPLNLLPADGSTGVSPNATLSWSPVAAADTYDIYLGTTDSPALAASTSATTFKPSLAAGTKYYWRVVARKSSESASSATVSFTTANGTEPGVPTNLNPADGSTIVSLTPILTWSAAAGATSYEVYFGTTARPDMVGETAVPQFPLYKLQENVTYYWRVVAKNALGSKGSATVSFRIERRLTEVLPRLAGTRARSLTPDTAEYTGIAIANLGTTDAVLQLTAFAADGTMITGSGITNPASMTLKPGQQVPVLDTQVFGDALAGTNKVAWMEVESSSEKITSYFMEFNSALTKLDGAPITNSATTSVILPDLETRGTTQISIANPSTAPARITFDVIDGDGYPLRSETRQLAPSGSLTESGSTLFPGLQVKSSQYVRITSDVPVSVVEFLRQTIGDTKSIAGIDASRGTRELYAPQFAVGGGWASTLSLINLETTPGTVILRFLGNDGGQIGGTRVVPIGPSGKIFVNSADFFGDLGQGLQQGYLEIISNGPKIAGSVMFGDTTGESFAAALPLLSDLQTSLVFSHVASSDLFYTGVALLNPNTSPTYATIDVYSSDGIRQYTVQEYIPSKGRVSKLLTQYFPAMADKSQTSGYIRVMSDRGIAAFALFGTPSALAALPAQVAP
jgi:hypothetical protein